MSDLYVDTTAWIPAAVLVASLAGSGHCVAMCGGLVVASAKTRGARIAYHLGRLAGYLALGAAAGWIGEAWLDQASWAAALVLGLSFLVAGFRVWRGRPVHLAIVPAPMLSKLFRMAGAHAGIAGLLTALLPCGWLHSFVLGAVATRSPVSGAVFLFAFWLGTLPALGFAPWLVDRIFRPIARRSPRIAALVLVSAGVMSIGIKLYPALFHCH